MIKSEPAPTSTPPTSPPPTATTHVISPFLQKKQPDQYGQRHPIETPELLASSLKLLRDELSKLPDEDRVGLDEALEKNPTLVRSDEHRLMFLRCEQFNVDSAAIRMAKYWNKRIELFGRDKAFATRLTLKETLKEDSAALSLGFARLLPEKKDEAGRALLLCQPTRLDLAEYDRESLVRATWYTMHAALEEESAQQKGVVFIVNNSDATFRHFDQTLVRMLAGSIRGQLPVRIGAMHLCHSSPLLNVVFQIITFFLGERLSKRIRVHAETDNAALVEEFETFGISADCVPVELGGKMQVDNEKWLADRRAVGK